MRLPTKNKYTNYLIAVLAALVLFIFILGYGIYRAHWRGNFIYALSAALPYPAILVNWEAVRYRAYLEELRALERYWEKQRQNRQVFLGIPENQEIKERLVNKLVEEKILDIWARKNGVRVEPEEVRAEWQRLQKKESASLELRTFLDQTYGWSEDKFQERVLYPFLLQQKVKLALAAREKADDDRLKKRAQEIYELTQKAGADFAELAREHSDDRPSARAGGDIGYFGRGAFEPAVEQTIFSLKIGEVSRPLKLSYGYHIIKLDDLLYDKAGRPTQAAAKQILIKAFDFDEWLEQQKNQAAIFRLVR